LKAQLQAFHLKADEKHPEQSLININTKNILFICGGALMDLEKIIERRISQNPVGFGADLKARKASRVKKLLQQS